MGKREIAGRLRAGMPGPYNSVSRSVGAVLCSARAAYPQQHIAQRNTALPCALCTALFVIFLLQLQILRPKRQFMQMLYRKAPFLLQ